MPLWPRMPTNSPSATAKRHAVPGSGCGRSRRAGRVTSSIMPRPACRDRRRAPPDCAGCARSVLDQDAALMEDGDLGGDHADELHVVLDHDQRRGPVDLADQLGGAAGLVMRSCPPTARRAARARARRASTMPISTHCRWPWASSPTGRSAMAVSCEARQQLRRRSARAARPRCCGAPPSQTGSRAPSGRRRRPAPGS